MSRIWLLTTNNRTLLPCLLQSSALKDPSKESEKPLVFGSVLFGHGGEVLMRKRPLSVGSPLVSQMDEKSKGYRHLAFFQAVNAPGFEIEQGQPFRHQGWVLGIDGDVPPRTELDDLSAEEAAFVRRNTRGQTPHEAFLHRVMVRLLAQGTTAFTEPSAQCLVDTIRSVLDETVGPGFSEFSLWLSSEHFGVVMSHGRPVRYRRVGDIARCSRCSEGLVSETKEGNRVGHPHVGGTMVVGGWEVEGADWQTVPDGQFLVIDGHLPPTVISASPPRAR